MNPHEEMGRLRFVLDGEEDYTYENLLKMDEAIDAAQPKLRYSDILITKFHNAGRVSLLYSIIDPYKGYKYYEINSWYINEEAWALIADGKNREINDDDYNRACIKAWKEGWCHERKDFMTLEEVWEQLKEWHSEIDYVAELKENDE